MAPSSRSSDPDRENFEPNRQSGFWEEISVILPSRHWQVPRRPPAGPLDETGLPLFRTLRPLAEDEQASSPPFFCAKFIQQNQYDNGLLLVTDGGIADPIDSIVIGRR